LEKTSCAAASSIVRLLELLIEAFEATQLLDQTLVDRQQCRMGRTPKIVIRSGGVHGGVWCGV